MIKSVYEIILFNILNIADPMKTDHNSKFAFSIYEFNNQFQYFRVNVSFHLIGLQLRVTGIVGRS